MALDNGAGGGGAIMLQEVLKNLADRAFQQQSLQQAAARTAIDQQRVDNETQLKNAALEETKARNASAAQAALENQGIKLGGTMAPETDVTGQPTVAPLRAAGLIRDVAPTLSSTNLSGGVTAGAQAPRIVGIAGQQSGAPNVAGDLTQTANAGQGQRQIYRGLDKQISDTAAQTQFQQLLNATTDPAERQRLQLLQTIPDADKRASGIVEYMKSQNPPKDTATVMAEKYIGIQNAIKAGQPVPPADLNWADSYKQWKNMGVDTSAGNAAAAQERTFQQQFDLQKKGQDYTSMKEGRKELLDTATTPYNAAVNSIDELRDVVRAAQQGNVTAGAMQNLQTAMTTIRRNGLNRINQAEIGAAGQQGSLEQRIEGWFGKISSGQPLSPEVQKDVLDYANVLQHGAERNYRNQYKSVVNAYGMKDTAPTPLVPLEDTPSKAPAGKFTVVEIK